MNTNIVKVIAIKWVVIIVVTRGIRKVVEKKL